MSDFYGYQTKAISNPFFTIEVLTQAGPRIVRMFPANSQVNLLAEVPEVFWDAPHGRYYPLGGHRLWVGPELPVITYTPDYHNVDLEMLPNGINLHRDDDYPESHLERWIEITLDPAAPKMKLLHRIANHGKEPITVIPWAITQFRLGGKVIMPFSREPDPQSVYMANRNLVIWPYTDLHESRLHLFNDRVELDAVAKADALKIGIYNPLGWSAIEFAEGWTLIKRFKAYRPEEYGDMNSNAQSYVRDAFIELESLGRKTLLQPGESVEHVEDWELLKGTFAQTGLL